MKISTILDSIDIGSLALPEFQRGYVWNRYQVKELMKSLYSDHPVGSLLVWETNIKEAKRRGDGPIPEGSVKLLLDGQQRLTSLYGIIRGKAPKFFDGNPDTFHGLYFHLNDEIFEFYMPMKMKDNAFWINVTELMQKGAGEIISNKMTIPEFKENFQQYINRLNNIDKVKNRLLHIETVSGEDKTVDEVVEIFNRVNSGGTKLSKGDLALAKVCAGWPEAREELKKRLTKWENIGFNFKIDWYLRCINTILTGEAFFTALKDIDKDTFEKGLKQAEGAIDYFLNLISSRLGLDHDRVLGSRYSFPLLVRYYLNKNFKLSGQMERDKLLYWYIHTFLWGRYAGSTESTLDQDLRLIEEHEDGVDKIINQLRQIRGDLRLHPDDFLGINRSARFYPMLYMLTRVWSAKDLETGIALSSHLLGHLNNLQLHHIFPKSILYEHNYKKEEVNALANFMFLTQETNLLVSNKEPEDYLKKYDEKNPGVLESNWIPMDKELWKIENYKEFLEARRVLLANAANNFLDSLFEGSVPETEKIVPLEEKPKIDIPGSILSKEEEDLIINCNIWITERGLPEGEILYELEDDVTGEILAILDLAWPNGLQEGFSSPVALLIDEENDTFKAANSAGFTYFTEVEKFKEYVEKEILTLTEV